MSNKKQHGIIFTTEMVNAILDGRKTQTRRVLKSRSYIIHHIVDGIHYEMTEHDFQPMSCKYGKVGDLLYVKEAWTHSTHPLYKFMYKAHAERHSGLVIKWKSPRFMPKKAARIWLEITNIRIERLHDITEQDAKAEGACKVYESEQGTFHHPESETARIVGDTGDYFTGFKAIWQFIKGKGSWDANPYVWVIEFRRVEP